MESEVSFESALQKLKSMFDCPTEDGHPAKGTWCGNCREICDADGTNWCDRNLYLGSVLAVEAAHKKEVASKDAEIAQLKACRDGECERIRLGAEPCKGCHVQVANDEIASLRAKRNELYDCNLKLRSLINEFVGNALLLKDAACVGCPKNLSVCEEQKCSLAKCTNALVAKAREVLNG